MMRRLIVSPSALASYLSPTYLRCRDITFRTLASAQVQSRQHNLAEAIGATYKKTTYVAKNAFRDIIGRPATMPKTGSRSAARQHGAV
jgi:hypothetical protein